MKKRMLAAGIAVILTISMLPFQAFAVETKDSGELTGDYVAVINTGTNTQSTGILNFDDAAGYAAVRSVEGEAVGLLPSSDIIEEETSFYLVADSQSTVSDQMSVSGQMENSNRIGKAKMSQPAPLSTDYNIGQEAVFYQGKSFICIAQGNRCFVWMEKSLYSRYSADNRTKAGEEVAQMYDGRPSQVIDELTGGSDFYKDGTGKLSILIEELGGSSGYYAGEDGITAIHINAIAPDRYSPGAYQKYDGLLVHETQHAIFRWLACNGNKNLAYELSWINEGLAVASMDYYWGGDDPTGWLSQINGNLDIRNGSSLIYSAYRNSSAMDYSMPYLFIRYLANQKSQGYLPIEMMKAFYNNGMSSSGNGTHYVSSVLASAGLKDADGNTLTFEKALAQFYVAANAQENIGVYGFYGDSVVRRIVKDYPVYVGESGKAVTLDGTAAIILKTAGGKFTIPSGAGSDIRFYAFNKNGTSALPAAGSGTPQDPYQIKTPSEYTMISSAPDACFRIMNDLDVSQVVAFPAENFTGIIDGNGKTIRGMSKPLVLTNLGNIKNLTVDGFSGEFGVWTGVISNFNSGTISDCRVTGTVNVRFTGTKAFTLPCFGTMTSQNEMSGSITRCYTDAAITVTMPSNSDYIGMIAGINKFEINNCYSRGSLNVIGSPDAVLSAGGIVGEQYSSIYPKPTLENSYSVTSIQVSGGKKRTVGQIAGYVQPESTLSGCYGINGTYPAVASGKTEGAEAKADAELKKQATYPSWKFGSIWQMESAGYPEFYNPGGASISARLLKTTYYKGESLDFYGAVLNVNGSQVPLTSDMVQGFESSTAGIKTINGSYKGVGFSLQVTVKEPGEVSVLEVYVKPKTTYVEGERFDPANTKLRATIDGKPNIYITSGFAMDKTAPLTVSDREVNYTYGTKNVSLPITVASKQSKIVSINVMNSPKLNYYNGDRLELDGLKAQFTYEGGMKSPIYSYSQFAANQIYVSRGLGETISNGIVLRDADNSAKLYLYYGTKLPKDPGSIYREAGQLKVDKSMILDDQVFELTVNKEASERSEEVSGFTPGVSGGVDVISKVGDLPDGITVKEPTALTSFRFQIDGTPTKTGTWDVIYSIKDKLSDRQIDVKLSFIIQEPSDQCKMEYFAVSEGAGGIRYTGLIDHDLETVTIIVPDTFNWSQTYSHRIASRNANVFKNGTKDVFANGVNPPVWPFMLDVQAENAVNQKTYTILRTILASGAGQLDQPAEISWEKGIFSWSEIPGATGYNVTLFRRDEPGGGAFLNTAITSRQITDGNRRIDFGSLVGKKGKYYVEVVGYDHTGSKLSSSPKATSLFEYTVPVIRSVTVSPDNVSIKPGNSAVFTVSMDGIGNFREDYYWQIVGQSSLETKITDNRLSIDADEKPGELILRAVSMQDETAYAEAIVNVEQLPQLSLPTGLAWNGDQGVWDKITGAEFYRVTLFKDFEIIGTTEKITGLTKDFTSNMSEDGIYMFRIQAVGTGYTDSEAVDSPLYQKGSGEITGVTITQAGPTLKPGDSFPFNAVVHGTGTFDNRISWSLEGTGIDSATSINSQGVLVVSAQQPEGSFSVKATAVGDPSKYQRVTVMVKKVDHPDDTPGNNPGDNPGDNNNPGNNPGDNNNPGNNSGGSSGNNGDSGSNGSQNGSDRKKSELTEGEKQSETSGTASGKASVRTKKQAVKETEEKKDNSSLNEKEEPSADWTEETGGEETLNDQNAAEEKDGTDSDEKKQEALRSVQEEKSARMKELYVIFAVAGAAAVAGGGGVVLFRYKFRK